MRSDVLDWLRVIFANISWFQILGSSYRKKMSNTKLGHVEFDMQEGKPCRKNLMNGVRKSLIQICGL
jgi:hypothetical protein